MVLLLLFFNAMQTHMEVAGLYENSFLFFNGFTLVFTKDKAYGNTRGHIEDDVTQYEYDDNIIRRRTLAFLKCLLMICLCPLRNLLNRYHL